MPDESLHVPYHKKDQRYDTFRMKFTPTILIVALAAGTGSGCPDTTACTKSCKKQGFSVGICLEPLLTVSLLAAVIAAEEITASGGERTLQYFQDEVYPVILIVALAAALLAAVIAAEEITASGGGGTGSGCPDTTACTKSCKKQGYSVGICLEPLLTVCACL
ncbi:hypothetical protein MRX96_035788 [Rhipicephalus microplus]